MEIKTAMSSRKRLLLVCGVACALVILGLVIAIIVISVRKDDEGTGYSIDNGGVPIPEKDRRVSRNYFLRAEQVEWDYLPLQENMVDSYQEYLEDTLKNKINRVGSKYNKYVFKQYTDGTYTQEIKSPPSFGYVGPLLRGEVGEVMRIHFRNDIDIPASVHPHGVKYTKANEGANYTDGTYGSARKDDGIPPGGQYTYTWDVTSEFSPRDGDPSCLPFAYHSHVHPMMDINSGLVGLLVVCKKGTLSAEGTRADVDREHVLYFDSIDEGATWLTDENLKRCGDPDECKRLYESGDPDFEESLKKDSINGYMYDNLPNMTVCAGERVAWYIFSLSAELHPVNIYGQTFLGSRHRSTVIGIWSATFREAEMVARNPGMWLVQCMNSEHNTNGMKVYLTVRDCGGVMPEQLSGRVRTHFLSAEMEDWNYAPSGRNLFDDRDLVAPSTESEKYFAKTYNGKPMIGGIYRKTRFFEYDSVQYMTRKNRTAQEEHMGLLGPVIRAELGDVVSVTLLNLSPFPVSVVMQGVSIDSSQNGMGMKMAGGGDNNYTGRFVQPGELGSYTFTVPWGVGPGDDDSACLTYMYYSGVNMERDINTGLVGPLLICRPGTLDAYSSKQRFVDREMFLYFASIDENLSWHIDHNVATNVNDSVDADDEDFVESNFMRAVNGLAYGNLEGLDVCRDDNVVWHVLSFGQTEGNHVVTFNGNNVVIDGTFRDSHVIISGQTFSALMKPDNVGNWSLYCHNTYHYDAGMTAMYHVDKCGAAYRTFYPTTGNVRHYYIAAIERKWDYSPDTIFPLDGSNYSHPSHEQHGRVQKEGKFIGSIYTKALYREFTDSTFTEEKVRSADEIHLGIMGPFIKAEVGDTIEVVFKNMASRPYSIHAQGVRYNKTYEGMAYADGQTDKRGDSVQPGSTFTYRWDVPTSSGPSNHGQKCVNFLYHSAVDPVRDVYAGLAGPIVVCRAGILDNSGKRTDSVEKEFALLFQAFDENKSWYLNQNIQENCPDADTSTPEFEESNKYDSINGLIYNNVQGLVAKTGDNIAWYVIGLGENEDMHTVHFHGHTYTYRTGQSHEGDVIEVFPGTYETVEMFANNPGTWLLHCHVEQHMQDGMIATYTILENNE
ncbi:hephaestin-like isoform X3 [Mya arenaria]|uniref:hephaestin-like isoform X3 n=1 Tax=Mya arenaria TaxID=6604 RepID=UPI0022E61DFE|nr:hephaestin-like isoform X3 [Mya arenaria]